MQNSYSAHTVTITITVSLIPNIHFPPFTTIHSITLGFIMSGRATGQYCSHVPEKFHFVL